MENPPTPPTTLAVSLNSVRHGLQTVALVIPGLESEADWRDFTTEALAALAPVGAVECAFADRVVELLWRLRRIARAEQRAITEEFATDRAAEERRLEDNREARRVLRGSFYESAFDVEPREISPALMPRDATLKQITRYEAHLSKQLSRALHELEVLQARRAGHVSPLLRLRIDGADEG
jgi:hypothetical protein